MESSSSFYKLVQLIARLTAPDGCPWDRVQTHFSILPNLIEEAYEAADAVLSGSTEAMCEEFGDCLLQVVLNCDIAARAGEFTLDDCITSLYNKLYSRHTHIFGTDHASSSTDALDFWDKAKSKEKNYTSLKDRLDKIPATLPALMRAQKSINQLKKSHKASSINQLEDSSNASITNQLEEPSKASIINQFEEPSKASIINQLEEPSNASITNQFEESTNPDTINQLKKSHKASSINQLEGYLDVDEIMSELGKRLENVRKTGKIAGSGILMLIAALYSHLGGDAETDLLTDLNSLKSTL